MVDDLRRLSSPPSVVNLSRVLVSLTSNVISRVALGRKYGDGGEGNVCRSFFEELLEILGTSPVGDYVPWLSWMSWINGFDARRERVAKGLDSFLEHVVREHREKGGDGGGEMDFVDILLEFQKERENSSPIDDDVVKAQILVRFSLC